MEQNTGPLIRAYEARLASKSDIHEHLPLLAQLASECSTIVEFGVRGGNSTIALLYGLAATAASSPAPAGALHSYDLEGPKFEPPALPAGVAWHFAQADTAAPTFLHPACDLLFIDTLHTREQVLAELRLAHTVRRYLVFHDTVLFGLIGEAGRGGGILQGIFDFLATARGREWQVHSHRPNNNGLLVLERAAPRPARRSAKGGAS